MKNTSNKMLEVKYIIAIVVSVIVVAVGIGLAIYFTIGTNDDDSNKVDCGNGLVCHNGGVCDTANGTCDCPNNWAGESCTYCAEGYSGDNCETLSKDCGGEPCLNGLCDDDGDCICNVGWQGISCNQCAFGYGPEGKCDTILNECIGGQKCLYGVCAPDGSCLCNDGWHGDACDVPDGQQVFMDGVGLTACFSVDDESEWDNQCRAVFGDTSSKNGKFATTSCNLTCKENYNRQECKLPKFLADDAYEAMKPVFVLASCVDVSADANKGILPPGYKEIN